MQKAMSALHLKADMCGANTDVCFGPAQQKGSLFDDLIGGDQQAWWNCQAKCLRRFARSRRRRGRINSTSSRASGTNALLRCPSFSQIQASSMAKLNVPRSL